MKKITSIRYEPSWIKTPGEGAPGARLSVVYNDRVYIGHITQKGDILGEINDLPYGVLKHTHTLAFCEEPGEFLLT